MNVNLLLDALSAYRPVFVESDGSYDDTIEFEVNGDLEIQLPRNGAAIVNYWDDVDESSNVLRTFARRNEVGLIDFIRETLG